MAQGNTGYRRIVHKATHWWKHGKHKGQLEHCIATNRSIAEREQRRRNLREMYASVREAFETAKKR